MYNYNRRDRIYSKKGINNKKEIVKNNKQQSNIIQNFNSGVTYNEVFTKERPVALLNIKANISYTDDGTKDKNILQYVNNFKESESSPFIFGFIKCEIRYVLK